MSNLDNAKNNIVDYSPKLVVIKSTNKSSVKVGDTFNYTVRITNTGDVRIINIVVTDILPKSFIVNGISVDGNLVEGDILKGLDIGELDIGDSRTVVLSIKVLSDLITAFNNAVVVDGEYEVEGEDNKKISEVAIEPIGVKVYKPDLDLYKSASKQYAVVGDIITYKVVASNIGDIPLEDVVISDLLSSELDFIEGSITIDGEEAPLEVITSGVNIGEINIKSSKIITFDAKILSNKYKNIKNTSIGIYDFLLDENIKQSGSISSNEVVISVEIANIKVIKEVDRTTASLGDRITYRIKLINDGTLDALNVIFIDDLSLALEVVNGTFNVDGKVINSVNISKGVNIGSIPSKRTVIVEYVAEVVAGACSGNIINTAKVDYKYILSDGAIEGKETIVDEDSTSIVNLNIASFKQISVDEYLRIPQQKPDMECINNITATVEIISSHLVRTPIDISNEAQKLSGYKLIVHGVLNQIVEYTANVPEQSLHAAHYNVPFSSFIILPNNFVPGSKIEVEGKVEDIYYKENGCRTFFKNVTVLLIAKIVSC